MLAENYIKYLKNQRVSLESAIDRVYYYRTTDEIKNMFIGCGLIIERELVLPVEDLPMEKIMNKKISINYCAILRKGEENGEI